MTLKRGLELAWSGLEGRDCLSICGWSDGELRDLGGLPVAELGRRVTILPTELVKSGADLRGLQPASGRFEVRGDALYFIPRFEFLDGTSYSVLVHPPPGARRSSTTEVWTVERPARAGSPATGVVAIYPTADELPVNQLKLYLHFSNPMSESWAGRAVRVRRADTGEPLQDVFLAMDPELWDRQRRRLTLLLDPGRIKRGLVPNTEVGYPLIEGVAVIVSVAAGFRDAGGRPLTGGAERRYTVGPPLRSRVEPVRWSCHCPAAESEDPLTVEFDRPLDHALLQRSLWVRDSAGRRLLGGGAVGPGERSWRFEPQSQWAVGRYHLIVDPLLEDLAGNSLVRVFDRDLTRPEDAPVELLPFALSFACVR